MAASKQRKKEGALDQNISFRIMLQELHIQSVQGLIALIHLVTFQNLSSEHMKLWGNLLDLNHNTHKC